MGNVVNLSDFLPSKAKTEADFEASVAVALQAAGHGDHLVRWVISERRRRLLACFPDPPSPDILPPDASAELVRAVRQTEEYWQEITLKLSQQLFVAILELAGVEVLPPED